MPENGSRKKRMLMPLPGSGIGGAQMSGMLLAHGLRDNFDWDVQIAIDHESPNRTWFEQNNMPVVSVANFRQPCSGMYAFRAARIAYFIRAAYSAYMAIRQFGPDVITLNAKTGLIAWAVAARAAKVPLVWYVRGTRSARYDALRIHLSSRMVFVADAVASHFESFTLPPNKTIHNGVRDVFFKTTKQAALATRQKAGLNEDDVLVVFVGNLIPRKRPIWAAERVIEALNGGAQNLHFLIVGEDRDPETNTRTITELFNEAGFANRLHIAGHRQDIPTIMKAADVLILTSEPRGEAFPRVIIEAMASGTSIVSTNVAGVAEAISDGHTGILIEPNDKQGFSDAIIRLSKEPATRKQICRKAKKVACRDFCQDRVIGDFSHFVSDLN